MWRQILEAARNRVHAYDSNGTRRRVLPTETRVARPESAKGVCGDDTRDFITPFADSGRATRRPIGNGAHAAPCVRLDSTVAPSCLLVGLVIGLAAVTASGSSASAERAAAPTAETMPAAQATAPDLNQPHPFSVHDLVRMERLGNPEPSPDEQWVVFTRRTWNPESNKTTTNLWLVSMDGTTLRQLTSAKEASDTSPVWSRDGQTIAFVSNRSGSQQIWTIRRDGGEARQLTRFAVDVDNLRWSPSGSHIALTAEVYPDLADFDATAKRAKEKADSPVKAMKFDRLFIRHWDTWFEGRRNHIFVLPVREAVDQSGDWEAAGEPVDLMNGVDADSPTRPFGGVDEYAWSPDSKEVAYTAQLGEDIAWSTDLNIYLVPVTGGPARCITQDNQATDTGPVYSPDGGTIAYRSMARPGFESDRYRIKLYDRRTGKTRTLTEDWDRSPGSLAWSPNGKALFVTAEERARQKIFSVDVGSGQPRALVVDHYNGGLAVVSGDPGRGVIGRSSRVVFAQDSLIGPAEIWSAHADGSGLVQLTHVNDQLIQLARMSQPEEFYFTGALGEKVQAWILKPVGFEPGKRYPVAFIIHGGPQGAISDHFHYRWNLQAFAGAGYAVVAVNFHGSTGFGQAFTDSISGDWGGKPFEDLMKGLDHALATYSWLDRDRVAALGASFGGWMINWINGHTDRFKCLVNHDGGFDEFSGYFTTEELWFPEWEFGGVPWKHPELYDKFSPGRYVANWQTPTLVIHGARDYRVVDSEGIATFSALQRKGIASQLLYFPDENHWVLKPKNSILWHETILAWLERWLKK